MKHLHSLLILILLSSQLLCQTKKHQESILEAKLYSDHSVVRIHIADGLVSKIEKVNNPQKTSTNLYIAPGLIDIQVNGYAGIDYTSEKLTIADLEKSIQQIWKTGVTTLFPTIITHSDKRIKDNFEKMSTLPGNEKLFGSVPGFHLEGPYISAEDGFRGVHLKEYVRKPNWDEFYNYFQASGNAIKLVTISPEYASSENFIKNCMEKGIVVGIGHHNGSPEQIKMAVDAGVSLSTHLGNGCINYIHRHNNILWPQLAEDKLTPTIIADGHHLNQNELIVFSKVKGFQNLILISDLMYFAGLEPGEYNYEGRKILLTPDNELIYPEQKVLAGAATPLIKGVENMMRFTGCSLGEAIDMASKIPAQKFMLNDRGEIEVGKRADFILFEFQDGIIDLKETIIKGNTVYVNE